MKGLILLLLLGVRLAVCGEVVNLTFDVARTPGELSWGMMGKESLPEDHGMLFIYPELEYRSLWMFNMWMDVSVAFLDANGRVIEIRDMIAYPEKMDPARPVRSLEDFRLYGYNDPVMQFFTWNRTDSTKPAKYALEMSRGWFNRKGVRVGDQLVLMPEIEQSYISKKNRSDYHD